MIPTPGTNVGQNGPQDQSYHNSGHGPVALTNNMNGYGQVQQIYSVPLHVSLIKIGGVGFEI